MMPYQLILEGKVQGVGCRYYCAKTAKAMKLKGSASNISDGTVRVFINTDDSVKAAAYAEALRLNKFAYGFYGRFTNIKIEKCSGEIDGDYNW